MSDQYVEPLNPEDIGLLVGLAGPLYAESKMIDSMTGIQPTTGGGYSIGGADTIKRGLENIVQKAKSSPPPSYQPPPQYFEPPQIPTHHYYEPSTTSIPGIDDRIPGQGGSIFPKENNDQLEFDFSLTEQKKTNELLEKNNRLLKKIISLLESKNKDEPIKLKTELKGVQDVSTKFSKD